MTQVAQRLSATPFAKSWTRNIARRPLARSQSPRVHRMLALEVLVNLTMGPQLEQSVKLPSSATSSVGSLKSLRHSLRTPTAQRAGPKSSPGPGAKSGLLSTKASQMLLGNPSRWENCWVGCDICIMSPLSVTWLKLILFVLVPYMHDDYNYAERIRSKMLQSDSLGVQTITSIVIF